MCTSKMKMLLFVALGSILLGASPAYSMNLDAYLDLVKQQSLTYRANYEKAVGLEMQLSEADLYFTPNFFIDAGYRDSSQPQNPPFYRAIRNKSLSLGVSQSFRFGLEAKLYYEAMGNEMIGTPAMPGFNIMSEYWDTAPKLELTMPLWSGGFGRRIKATEESLRKQVEAEKFAGEAETLSLLAQAEANYWKLSIWQEVVSIEEQALQAAKNILDNVTRKSRMNLGEESDVVQAQALVEGKRLDLKMAKDERRAAQRAFNKFINRNPMEPIGTLQKVNYKQLEEFAIPQNRPGDRADIRALQAQADYAAANARLARERGKPKLDFFGNFALHGQKSKFAEAVEQSFDAKYDTTHVGFNFSVPLFFGALSDLETGALKVQQAAELTKEAAVFNQEQEWVNLVETLKDIRENLKQLSKLEDIQKRKLEVERRRFKQGRTTIFQVLMFEQEYSQASVSRAKLASEILALSTQIQLYQPVKGN